MEHDVWDRTKPMGRIKLQGEFHVRACLDGESGVCVRGVERTRCEMMGFVQVLYVESIDAT